jgi:hypothetical protein
VSDKNWFELGQLDCYQDRCENCPFASIGGLESRSNPQVPKYVPENRKDTWLDGYLNQALNLYGEDWATLTLP